MANVKCTVSLQMVSGIAADKSVNVFHFISDKVPATNAAILTALQAFYNQIGTKFGGSVAQNGHTVQMYDLADPQPRAPFYSTTFGLTSAPTGNSLPQEVALCLSFQGNRVSGESQARRRGRVYIGPFSSSQVDSSGRPVSALVSSLVTAGAGLLAAANAAPEWQWGIWSTVDNEMVTVTNGWVDNAFDTQRRRGLDPTTRTTW